MENGGNPGPDKNVEAHLAEKKLEFQGRVAGHEALIKHLQMLLDNFAYRYLVTSENQNVSSEFDGKTVRAEALEKNMKEALKYAHPKARAGIVKLLQTVPFREGPSVKYILGFECLEWSDEGRGEIRAFGKISWDHPQHLDSQKSFAIDKVFKSSDALDFRNRFPRFVEQDICQVFSGQD